MKKTYFLILISILFILVLFYFYDEKEEVLNREYRDYKNNIFIDYPYFNDVVIDNYLNDYLEPYMDQRYDLMDLLFIDYDYEKIDGRIELILYIYQEKDNVVRKYSKKIEIDYLNSKIIKTSNIWNDNILDNIYNNRTIDKNGEMIALTFDDGPNHNTSRVLDILEKYKVKATFFVLGSNIVGNDKLLDRMNSLGMEIGNHMDSHKLLTKLEDNEIKNEVSKVDKLVFDIVGKVPSLIRPSYGTVNSRIRKLMDRPIVIWNVDSLDWKYHNSKGIADRVLRDIDDGDIILMHDIYRATANSLEIIIPKLLESGYQLVTVSELLVAKGIKIEKGGVYSRAK